MQRTLNRQSKEDKIKPADTNIENPQLLLTDAILRKGKQQATNNTTEKEEEIKIPQNENQTEVLTYEIDNSYHVKIPKYDIKSCMQSMGNETTNCTGCDSIIGKEMRVYSCKNYINEHVLCLACMTDPEDKTLLAEQCRHGNYDETESYEACVGETYFWMNRDKRNKQMLQLW
jgi:hypothetical protein